MVNPMQTATLICRIGNAHQDLAQAHLYNGLHRELNQIAWIIHGPSASLRTHSGEKSNKCNHCEYASSDTSTLRKHLAWFTTAGVQMDPEFEQFFNQAEIQSL